MPEKNGSPTIQYSFKELMERARLEQEHLDAKLEGVPVEQLKGLPDRVLILEQIVARHEGSVGTVRKVALTVFVSALVGVGGLLLTLARLLPALQKLAGPVGP